MKRRGEKLIWVSKPGLLAFVLGRSFPIVMGTAVYLGSPLAGLFSRWAPSAFSGTEALLFWAGAIGLTAPFLLNFIDWIFTRYELTDQTLVVRSALGSRSIPRSQILSVESERETLDGFYPRHFGSLLLTVRERGHAPLPIVKNVLVIAGIPNARQTEATFQTAAEVPSDDWRLGSTRMNLVRLESRSR